MTLAADLAEAIWDVAKAAREMPRFEFILTFVQRQTTKKRDRDAVDGYRLLKSKRGWIVRYPNGIDLFGPSKDAAKAYDAVRRGPMNYYVRQAEDLRAEVLG